jgi:hypothetical protein
MVMTDNAMHATTILSKLKFLNGTVFILIHHLFTGLGAQLQGSKAKADGISALPLQFESGF